MSLGIKETLDVLVALEVASDAAVKACADGKLNLFDLPLLAAPVRAAIEAVRGRAVVIDELKDLDAAEVEALLNKCVSAGMKLLAALDAVGGVVAP